MARRYVGRDKRKQLVRKSTNAVVFIKNRGKLIGSAS